MTEERLRKSVSKGYHHQCDRKQDGEQGGRELLNGLGEHGTEADTQIKTEQKIGATK